MNRTDRITHIAILCQILQNYLINAKGDNYYKKGLKFACNSFLKQLVNVEKYVYDLFFEKSEDNTVVVYELADKFYKEVANVTIYDMDNILKIIQAYKKDGKSIEGIVNKILK